MLNELSDFLSNFQIPAELIFFEIFPYLTKFELTPSTLVKTKARITLYSMIRNQLRIECKKLRKHLFKHYHGEDFFEYETMDTYLYLHFDLVNRNIDDFISIFH